MSLRCRGAEVPLQQCYVISELRCTSAISIITSAKMLLLQRFRAALEDMDSVLQLRRLSG